MRSGVPLKAVLPMFGRTIIDSPDLVLDLARGVYKKHVSSVLDYYLKGDGRSSSLWVISMRVTNLCNHRCAICAQWGCHGYNIDRLNPKLNEIIPMETYKNMVDDIAHIKPHIYITGGEPFLYKDLVPMVNYFKSKKLCIQIVTNGVLLEKYAEEIVDNQWDVLCVSIDGTREIHDKCRGAEGAYDTLLKGLEKIRKLKTKKKLPKPYIITLTTISEQNAPVLVESLDEARQLSPDAMVVYYSWFTTEEIGKSHSKAMERKLGISPTAWKGFILERNGVDLDALVGNVREIKSSKFDCPVLFVPDLKEEDIARYYLEPDNLFGYGRCVAPWFMVDIMPNGDVVTCRDHPDYLVGNIKNSSLTEIYNNDKYMAFRRALRSNKKGLFPICSRCCGLMGY